MGPHQTYASPPESGALRRLAVGARDLVDSVAAHSPARFSLIVFLLGISIFTALLSLPAAATSGRATPLHDSLFTAVSAVCVTGLTVVSTATHWTFFGQVVIIAAVFVGGLGIITLASVLALAVSKRLGVRGKLMAQRSMNAVESSKLGEVGALLRTVIITSVSIQLLLALMLAPRFLVLGEPFGQALWHGIFYSISAFNNGGFTAHPDGLAPYQTDLWILVPVMLGVFIGSLGFPVVMVLIIYRTKVRKWTLHSKLTLVVSAILLVGGALAWAALEWNNPRTIAGMGVGDKVLNALFASVMTRSGGFNLVEQGDMESTTMLLTDALMFAGGGSASTAGGIKVTTIAVMFLAIFAEARGDTDVRAFGRRIPEGTMRVAISVLVLGATLVSLATGTLLAISGDTLDRVLFESISAFATVGLSTGLSGELPPSGKYVLSALMFAGRVGTITLASALALRQRDPLYHYPEERPIIG